MPTQSAWSELWQADPALYIALQSTTLVNNAMLSLFLVAAFSVIYDMCRLWISRRTRQTFDYQIISSAVGNPAAGSLRKLAYGGCGSSATVFAKATVHSAVFIGLQYTASLLIIQIARVIADVFMTDGNLRQQCSHQLARGLECSAARRYHNLLNIATVLMLLCIIRGFGLHIEVPKQRRARNSTNHSPGFVKLQSKCRWMAQMVLAAPIAVVYMYTRASRQTSRKAPKLLLVQASASCVVFLLGNFVCLLAALPDFQGTMEALEELGILGQSAM